MSPLPYKTMDEYLQSGTGLRNLILTLVVLLVSANVLDADSYGALVEFLRVLLAVLLAAGVFVNLWLKSAIWLGMSYIIWQSIVFNLWWDLGRSWIVPFVFVVFLLVVGYGFIFGGLVKSHLESRSGQQGKSVRNHWLVARFGIWLSEFLPFLDRAAVPLFALPAAARGEIQQAAQPEGPSYVYTAPIMETLEVADEPVFSADPATQPAQPITQEPSVTSAPIAGSVLYAYTFLLEFVGAVARTVVTAIIATIALFPVYFLIFSINTSAYYRIGILSTFDGGAWLRENTIICMSISLIIGAVFGFWPIVASLFHIFVPVTRSGSGPLERDTLGAREPTRGEMEKIIDTIQFIQATSGKVITKGAPSEWLVLDEPFPDSYTIGSTVYLTRAAIESEYLPGIMAHEMGHVAHKDGDLLLSLRRFIVPLAYWVGIDRQATAAGAVLGTGATARVPRTQTEDEKIFFRFQSLKIKLWLAFWFGGLGLLLLGRAWARFWRYRDFLADNYVVFVSQEDSLMSALEVYRHVDVAQPYLLTNRPYTAERLDRLKG